MVAMMSNKTTTEKNKQKKNYEDYDLSFNCFFPTNEDL
jgi:hypothetical protein